MKFSKTTEEQLVNLAQLASIWQRKYKGKKRFYSEEIKSMVRHLVNKGVSAKAIEKRTNIHHTTIYGWMESTKTSPKVEQLAIVPETEPAVKALSTSAVIVLASGTRIEVF